ILYEYACYLFVAYVYVVGPLYFSLDILFPHILYQSDANGFVYFKMFLGGYGEVDGEGKCEVFAGVALPCVAALAASLGLFVGGDYVGVTLGDCEQAFACLVVGGR
ncbi:MAG: hypothetical protein RIS47_1565, partial [Bacteroidota bacterium]